MKLFIRFRKAAALPFVLLLVALNVTVVVALLIYATTELQASRNSGQTEVARGLAQSGIDLAAGLIAAHSTNNAFVTYQRVTNVGGAFRLETKIANVTAPDASKPWKTVATNPAVLHSGFVSGNSGVDLNFAVAGDPSAGFIAPRTNLTGWTNLSPNMFRLDWIYVYKGDTNDPKNLVGRIAYWVDDESSKLNVNYSGSTEVYGTGFDNSQPLPLAIRGPRPGVATNGTTHGYFNGRNWPMDMELGGIAGISIQNVKDMITWRQRPDGTNFRAFPSALGLRIGTLSGAGGLAVTNLQQQSALGFTATAFSKEEERSYISGRKRYDLLNLYSGATNSVMADLRNAITNDYPAFASKYDLDAFAGAAYSLVQVPGTSTSVASAQHPATTFGSERIYSRGLPVVNEIIISATAVENAGINTVELRTAVELIILGFYEKTQDGWNQSANWAASIEKATGFVANVSLFAQAGGSSPPSFGGWSPPSPLVLTNSGNVSATWFAKRNANPNGSGQLGPNSANFAGAFGILAATNNFSTNAPLGTWNFPSRLRVELSFNGKKYQDLDFEVAAPPGGAFTPTAGQTNVVYALVSQPRASEGFRGDPRFGIFQGNATADLSSGFPADYAHPQASPNALNPNWKLNDFAAAQDRPDLVRDSIFFADDFGNPTHTGTLRDGFGWTMAGPGWLGEVPVTKPANAADSLAWSTPRLWGDGRESANTPPDWLLLDVFHMGMFRTNTNGTFSSFGRVNVNSAKSFFQPIAGSTLKADTIMDSVVIGASTKDFRTEVYGNRGFKGLDGRQPYRTNVLARINELQTARTSTNNPYTTHFEFLAELAATNMPGNPDWWMGPLPVAGDIYAATNTTDRRIEGIVRSLNQKVTTHGNQFTIFSLGQALQVTASGQTNVVGEAYLQAVYERAPQYDEATGSITNSPTGAPPMRQLYLRELRY